MRVQKVRHNGGYEFTLLDDEGLAIPVVSKFLSYLRARGCSPNTLCAYAHDLQHFYRFLKGASIQVQDFTPRRPLDFLQYLRAVPSRGKARKLPAAGIDCGAAPQSIPQLAATTVNRILAAVSTFYEYIILTNVSDGENPLRKIPDIATARVVPRYTPFLSLTAKQRPVRRVVRVRTAQRLPRPLADDQVTKLFGAFTRRRDQAIFLLMLQGGLRPGEVLNLHLEDVQYGRRRVTVRYRTDHPKGARTKSSVERVVDLHEPETLATVSAYMLQERPSDTSETHLFLVGGGGKKRHEPLGYAALVTLFRRQCERLGFHERGSRRMPCATHMPPGCGRAVCASSPYRSGSAMRRRSQCGCTRESPMQQCLRTTTAPSNARKRMAHNERPPEHAKPATALPACDKRRVRRVHAAATDGTFRQ